jgi:hypothetical protein
VRPLLALVVFVAIFWLHGRFIAPLT